MPNVSLGINTFMAKRAHYLNNEKLPLPSSSYGWSPEMLSELGKCKESLLYFAENYFTVINVDDGEQKIKLYPFQRRILKALVKNRFVITLASRQCGKALDENTPIPTPKGYIRMGDLKTGDQVFGADGQPCNITHAFDTLYNRKCYKVIFDNDEEIIADADHLWFTQDRNERKRIIACEGSVKTTEQVKNTLFCGVKKEPMHRIKMAINGIEYPKKELPIDPYVLGLWLGDGTRTSSNITVGERDKEDIRSQLYINEQFKLILINSFKEGIYAFNPTNEDKNNSLRSLLKRYNLLDNKHIPDVYLYSDRNQRLELLKGLMDSDGYISKRGGAYFYNTDLDLAKKVEQLIQSLGYKTTYKEHIPHYNGMACKTCATVYFEPREYVCTIKFKKDRIKFIDRSKSRNQYFYIKDIQEVETRPVRCIAVDSPDHLYLAGKSHIPTHNSSMMCMYSLWRACFNKHQRIVIAANREDTAIEIFGRIKLAYEMIPNWLKPGIEKWGETGMKLENGSYLSVETTSMNTGRGKSANLIIIDEMAFIPKNIMEQFWKSISATISSSKTAQIFVVSTANGTDNLFYELYRAATSVDPESTDAKWHAENVSWEDVPGRGKKWKEDTLATLNGDEEAFAQEYENKFVSIGTGSIDETYIEYLRHRVAKPIMELDNGHYSIFEMPNQKRVYAAGVDVSDGIGDAASVVEVFDITDLTDIKQVAEYHNREIDPLSFTRKVYQIAMQWGSPMLAIERNNMGGTVVDTLIETYGYTRLLDYVPGKFDDYNKRGVFSHTNVRYDSVTNMRYWVNLLKCVSIRSPGLVEELRTFVKHPNGIWKKLQGKNIWDDRVMAMIWALFVLESGVAEKYYEVVDRDRNGKVSHIIDENMFVEALPVGELRASLEGHYYDEPPPFSFDSVNINLDPEDMDFLYGIITPQQTNARSVPFSSGYTPGS